MDASDFYRPPSETLNQGDIIRELAHPYVKTLPIQLLNRQTLRQGVEGFVGSPYVLGVGEKATALHSQKGGLIAVDCHVALGMVLSHDCEIDQDGRGHRLVAMIRPLDTVADESHREQIRQSRNAQFFHLPEHAAMPESYVDFRRLSTVLKGVVDDLERVSRLTDEAVRALQVQFIRFVTRRNLVD